MNQNEPVPEVSVSREHRPTRWNEYRRPAPSCEDLADDRQERGGIYLAAFAALLLPVLIVAAVLLSNPDRSTELEQADVASTTTAPSTTAPPSTVPPTAVPPTAVPPTAVPPTTVPPTTVPQTTGASTTASSTTASGPDAPVQAAGLDAVQSAVAGTTERRSSESADAPTLAAPSPIRAPAAPPSTTRPPTTTTAPTTGLPTTDARVAITPSIPSTTARAATPSTTTTPQEPENTVTLSERIDIGQLGDTYVRVRFTADATVPYQVVVLGRGQVTASRGGTAVGGQSTGVSIDGLTPGTDYNVQVILSGPPEFRSAPVSFRTSGGDPAPSAEPVALLDLRVIETRPTRVELNYETNICANGSFVIRATDGSIVGSNSGQSSGCTTRHLAIPGFWTRALEPNTTYRITVTVEAGGAGRGDGNTASQTMSITTSG